MNFMKKMLCLVMTMLLLFSMAYAEKLEIDLSSASDEELANAITLIKEEQRSRLKCKIILEPSELDLEKGKSQKITATIADLPEGTKAGSFTWTSNDTSIASCSKGAVKAISAGSTTILCTATLSDGTELEAECTVNVIVPVKTIKAESKEVKLGVDETLDLSFTVTPDDATNKELEYSSSDESVVTVDENGAVTGVGIGNAVVTASSADGGKQSASVKVKVYMKDDVGVTKTNDNDVSVTLLSFRTSKGSGYFKPESGNIFVLPMFEIKNNSSEEVSSSTLLCYSAVCDGYSIEYSFDAACAEKNGLDVTVRPGKSVKGEYGFEVPSDWKELEVEVNVPWLSDSLYFVIYNQ